LSADGRSYYGEPSKSDPTQVYNRATFDTGYFFESVDESFCWMSTFPLI